MNASSLPDIRLDAAQLYREEQYTDRRVGSLRRLVPVTPEGVEDPTRAVEYEGQATLMTQAGALPLHFAVEADSLAQALERFPAAAQAALKEMMEEMERLRREQASSLLVPGRGAPAAGPRGGPGGGLIQF